MSAYNAPSYYFSGIGFNTAFYKTSGVGLTVSQANSLYLQKTVPDTATAVETFSGGIISGVIKTNTIDAASLANPLTIGTLADVAIYTGSPFTSTYMSGNVVINNTLLSSSIEPITSIGSFTICPTGNGLINIGTLYARTSSINIGNSNTNIQINGPTYVARNFLGANPTYFEMVSGLTSQYIDFHCNSANNVDYDARLAISGGTATLGNGDVALTSKSLTISSPLTLGSAPTLNTQLGFVIQALANSSGTGSATLSVWTAVSPTFTVPTGTWIINVNLATNQNASVSYSTNTTPTTNVNQVAIGNYGCHFSDIVNVAGTYTILGYSYLASTSYIQIYVTLTRIA